MKFNVLLVIPARYGSTRLPGKPLKKIGNKTMIQRVYDQAKKVNCSKTIVATDDKRIFNHCIKNNMTCVMTKKTHQTGSDRISEVSKKYKYNWVLNLQGDEPLINVSDVKNLIKKSIFFYKKQKFSVSTLYFKKKETNIHNPNEARLLINKNNEVIIFTRKKITNNSKENMYLKHIGIFLYRKNFLHKFSKLKERFLEKDQRLEQLRVLENGYKIIAFRAKNLTRGVDSHKDLCNIRKKFK